jgi:hypothetical protein
MAVSTYLVETQIREIVNIKTQTWNDKDIEKLLSVFHPDMVWPWPRTPESHDPIDWVFGMGRFNHERWKRIYSDFFESHMLIHNVRKTLKIVVSHEDDGSFAVVDVDTLWHNIKTKGTSIGREEHAKSMQG